MNIEQQTLEKFVGKTYDWKNLTPSQVMAMASELLKLRALGKNDCGSDRTQSLRADISDARDGRGNPLQYDDEFELVFERRQLISIPVICSDSYQAFNLAQALLDSEEIDWSEPASRVSLISIN